MPIKILAVGKRNLSWVETATTDYSKRLRAPFDIEWLIIPHSSHDGLVARQEESKRLLSHIKPTDSVILLDERGQQMTSPELSRYLSAQFNRSASLVIIIGGAYGVNETIFQRANLTWSLSKLVFPHQLVRIILTEQIYRAQQIELGTNYHHK